MSDGKTLSEDIDVLRAELGPHLRKQCECYGEPEVTIRYIGGNCPVQAEGTVDGKQFYFRARGDSLQMSVHDTDPLCDDAWFFEQGYRQWPEAGWIAEDLARLWIAFALAEWKNAVSRQKDALND